MQKHPELYGNTTDEPNDNLADAESFKSKIKIRGKTPNNDNEKDVEIMVPSKYLSNFWRNLEMSLINCEVNQLVNLSNHGQLVLLLIPQVQEDLQ